MNSEITNVVKLSPVTVVKADKQTDDRSSSKDVIKGEQLSVSPTPASTPTESSNPLTFQAKQEDDKKTNPKTPLEDVKKAADEGNALLQEVKRNLQFKVDDTTNELVVKIVDSETGELVRQIPSEEMLAFIKHMKEMDGHQGSMIQDRA
ncbi:flagellar protein FlaG [Methylomonas sp. HYX-M1]|uniref:flagellar protein FlaG n=1 Tax=Methylomonas sp. HYX-M1 TaxID=3139307 RepID=UPI00345BE58C